MSARSSVTQASNCYRAERGISAVRPSFVMPVGASAHRPCPTLPHVTDTDRLTRFAELVVRVGVNVQPGSGVLLGADTAHLEIARAVVEQAYAAGAAWVEIDW